MAEERKQRKPIPRVDEESKPFWEACARHELYVQKCRHCGKVFYYPRSFCPEDLTQDLEWVKCSGRGKVYTFTVTYQNQSPGFRENLPYVMAYVELEEGVRMLTNIVGCKPEEVRIDMPVEVAFEDVTPDLSIPVFKPVGK
ncbi:MAG: Zn-ribbon domain-containing OB-fold protein [Candidatus Binatia bacterium]|nr:Zn-ribbon domain-containing OB-fold protein [Candidatus Binatia bacterium]